MDTAVGHGRLHFGIFDVDLRAGELRRAGHRVPLQYQPFQILCALLENPGQVVTREELRSRLWANGAYLDFDRSLNKAMVKLRDALGDDAVSPRFIETLPRRGYRFIGDVVQPTMPEVPLALVPNPVIAEPERAEAPTAIAPPPRRAHSAWWLGAIALALAVLAFFLRTPSEVGIVDSVQLTHSPTTKYPVLQSDGKWLYYNVVAPSGEYTIMRLALSGGEPTPLAFGVPNLMMYALSPDGAELLAASVPPTEYTLGDHQLWRLPLRGGPPQRVGTVVGVWASWSRDGQHIYFNKGGQGGLSVVSRDGSGAHLLLTAEKDVSWSIESPDGMHLRYSVYQGANHWQLWEAGIDGGAPHPLLPGWNPMADSCCGRWTADGSRYVFQSNRNGQFDLWMLDEGRDLFAGTAVPVRLSSGPMSLRAPLPGFDGHTLYALGEQTQGELMHYESARHEFVPYLGGVSAEGVNFTADGRYAVYASYPQGELWSVRADGTDKRQLTFAPMQASVPAWSPDGHRIAFVGRNDGVQSWQIYVVSEDGADAQALTADSHDQVFPAWTPDGSALIFSGMLGESSSIHIMDMNSRHVRTVAGSQGMCCATWIPHDKRLLAVAPSPRRLVLLNPVTGDSTELYRGRFKYFASSHDGRYVYFDSGVGVQAAVYRIPIDGGEREHVADLDGVRRTFGPLGPWMDLAPDDSPMLLRNTSSQEIYALTLAPR